MDCTDIIDAMNERIKACPNSIAVSDSDVALATVVTRCQQLEELTKKLTRSLSAAIDDYDAYEAGQRVYDEWVPRARKLVKYSKREL